MGGGGLVAKSCLILVTPWTVARRAPLSTGFFRQEYWIGLSFLSPGHLPDPVLEPRSPALQADSLPTTRKKHGRIPFSPHPVPPCYFQFFFIIVHPSWCGVVSHFGFHLHSPNY